MADIVPVHIAGIVMDNEPDANGVRWRVLSEGLVGWAAPAVDVQQQNRTGRHGIARASAYYRARDVAVRGRALAPTLDAAWGAYYQLVGLTQLGWLGDLTVMEPVPKRLTVELGDDPDLGEPLGDARRSWRVPFQLPLSATYPFKHALTATTVTVAGGATVSHTAAGTFPAEIEVTLTSAGTVDLTIAGLRLRAASLPSGAVLTSGPGFPHPKRTIRSSANANLFGSIVQPMQWPAMVPGVNSIHQAGTAGLSVRYFPTYA